MNYSAKTAMGWTSSNLSQFVINGERPHSSLGYQTRRNSRRSVLLPHSSSTLRNPFLNPYCHNLWYKKWGHSKPRNRNWRNAPRVIPLRESP